MNITISPTRKRADHGTGDATIFTGVTESGLNIVAGVTVLSAFGHSHCPSWWGIWQHFRPPFRLTATPHVVPLTGMRTWLWTGRSRCDKYVIAGLGFLNAVSPDGKREVDDLIRRFFVANQPATQPVPITLPVSGFLLKLHSFAQNKGFADTIYPNAGRG